MPAIGLDTILMCSGVSSYCSVLAVAVWFGTAVRSADRVATGRRHRPTLCQWFEKSERRMLGALDLGQNGHHLQGNLGAIASSEAQTKHADRRPLGTRPALGAGGTAVGLLDVGFQIVGLLELLTRGYCVRSHLPGAGVAVGQVNTRASESVAAMYLATQRTEYRDSAPETQSAKSDRPTTICPPRHPRGDTFP